MTVPFSLRLTEAQRTVLRQLALRVAMKRGGVVHVADLLKEGVANLCRRHGLRWPEDPR